MTESVYEVREGETIKEASARVSLYFQAQRGVAEVDGISAQLSTDADDDRVGEHFVQLKVNNGTFVSVLDLTASQAHALLKQLEAIRVPVAEKAALERETWAAALKA
jgi:hypothetical protein